MNQIVVRPDFPRRFVAKIPGLVAYRIPADAEVREVIRKEDGETLSYIAGRLNFPGGFVHIYISGFSELGRIQRRTIYGTASVWEKNNQNGVINLYVNVEMPATRDESPSYRMTVMDGASEEWVQDGWLVYDIPQRSRNSTSTRKGGCLIFAPVLANIIRPIPVTEETQTSLRAIPLAKRQRTTPVLTTECSPSSILTASAPDQRAPATGSLYDQLQRLKDMIHTSN